MLERGERLGIVFIPWGSPGSGSLSEGGGRFARSLGRRRVDPAQVALAWLLHRSS